jgi:hypothetical protein
LFLGAGGSIGRGFHDAGTGNGIRSEILGATHPQFLAAPLWLTLQSETFANLHATDEVALVRMSSLAATKLEGAIAHEWLHEPPAYDASDYAMFDSISSSLVGSMDRLYTNEDSVDLMSMLYEPFQTAQKLVRQNPRPGKRPLSAEEEASQSCKDKMLQNRAIGFNAMQIGSSLQFSIFYGLHELDTTQLDYLKQLYRSDTKGGKTYRSFFEKMEAVALEFDDAFINELFETTCPSHLKEKFRPQFEKFMHDLKECIARLQEIKEPRILDSIQTDPALREIILDAAEKQHTPLSEQGLEEIENDFLRARAKTESRILYQHPKRARLIQTNKLTARPVRLTILHSVTRIKEIQADLEAVNSALTPLIDKYESANNCTDMMLRDPLEPDPVFDQESFYEMLNMNRIKALKASLLQEQAELIKRCQTSEVALTAILGRYG